MRAEIDAAKVVVPLVYDELDRQYEKWGLQSHSPDYWWLIVSEEFGEVAKAMCEGRDDDARIEIVHVIACLVHTYEALQREKE